MILRRPNNGRPPRKARTSRDTGRALQGHRLSWPVAAPRARRRGPIRHPNPLPSIAGGGPGGVAGCPNAAQPILITVNPPFLGLLVGVGKRAVARVTPGGKPPLRAD